MSSSSRTIEHVAVTFDEPTLVADAGLVVPATPMIRLCLGRAHIPFQFGRQPQLVGSPTRRSKIREYLRVSRA